MLFVGTGFSGGEEGALFFFQAEDGIRDVAVTGVQTCALPIWSAWRRRPSPGRLRRSHGSDSPLGLPGPTERRGPAPGRRAPQVREDHPPHAATLSVSEALADARGQRVRELRARAPSFL